MSEKKEVRLEGFVKGIGIATVLGRRTVVFHSHQSDPKEIPYEGPMLSAVLIVNPIEQISELKGSC